MHIFLLFQVPPCPTDYRLWLQTMYVCFGQKWMKLHHGPLWSVAASMQSDMAPDSALSGSSITAKPRSASLPILEVQPDD